MDSLDVRNGGEGQRPGGFRHPRRPRSGTAHSRLESPTGKRVYDVRHTRLTKWLNDGIPPAQVADWVGNRVPVLLATYARCVEGQPPDLKRRLEAAADLPERPDVG
ncbi:site-specific integrase [Streptomyces griseoluteus]|uniref:hypothetical protein n=1 Tax=Streptomyces griseoluteus TaxID=29306 RepID=UPI0036FD5665